MAPSERTRARTRSAAAAAAAPKARRTTQYKKKKKQKEKRKEVQKASSSSLTIVTSSDDVSKNNISDHHFDSSSSSSGCSTPRAERYRIPEIVTCPPAPKKQRVVSNCSSLQRTPIAFFAPPDLELFFFCALRDISV
ncbi:cyclin-dependent protein kinase inhibitor SMR13-like [Mangifera indica]|uniref:cyclin-dependent protein kinase inhibitor SMR13-like n=1 Tax=Mangifera indica TaxID=29780 RepID=UPI001CFA80B7|nr:cyclin-dependent protein kinase inhibitor SMR13-like [Mangifera indica]